MSADSDLLPGFLDRADPRPDARGWLAADDAGRCRIVADYFARSGRFEPAEARLRTRPGRGDPLYGVWAARSA